MTTPAPWITCRCGLWVWLGEYWVLRPYGTGQAEAICSNCQATLGTDPDGNPTGDYIVHQPEPSKEDPAAQLRFEDHTFPRYTGD